MNQIKPLATAQAVTETYGLYLKSLIRPKNQNIFSGLNKCIDDSIKSEGGIVKGPFIEATPPYVSGSSIKTLIDEGVLSKEFEKLNSLSLPIDRGLYKHQEESIRKVVSGRNVLVATGTGSGKTESFLIPILNELMREIENGQGGPGVRALLLYPMNALANDQVKRIREILANYPQITFGRYTGETEELDKRARSSYLVAEGKQPTPNELISREAMRETPPNILLTNYAMLEYLLLRPDDSALFQSVNDSEWKFIVADEAHTYDGAHGVEVATLLRKLRERVDPDKKIQTIGTTATIGGTNSEIESFAKNFFGNSYAIDVAEGEPGDLVKPQRASIESGTWGPISVEDWLQVVDADDFETKYSSPSDSSFTKFQTEKAVATLRKSLLELPKSLAEIAVQIFGNDEDNSQLAVSRIVELGAKIKNSSGLQALSARFHLFARSTEGVFGCLSADPHFYLSRRHTCDTCEKPTFEYAGCNKCGATFFIGYDEQTDDKRFLKPEGTGSPLFIMSEDIFLSSDNEDDELADEASVANPKTTESYMCVDCGKLSDSSAGFAECDSASVVKISIQDSRNFCGACGGQGRPAIRKLESGNDAAASVLATEMYQHMPAGTGENDFDLPGQGRKIMVFSDNRQQAAYFAPYIQDRYEKILWRKVIFQALQGLAKDHPSHASFHATDLVGRIVSLANEAKMFDKDLTPIGRDTFAKQRLHYEIVNTETQNNLEGIGLVSIGVDLPEDSALNAAFAQYGLSADDGKNLVAELINTLRLGGVVSTADGVQPDAEMFKPRLGPLYVREFDPKPKKKIYSWLPAAKNNTRLDYLQRVLVAAKSEADPRELMSSLWNALTNQNGLFAGTLSSKNLAGNGVVHQINHSRITLTPITEANKLFQCDKCGRVTSRNILNVCPRYKCSGALQAGSDDVVRKGLFYRRQYENPQAVALIAKEHTAQLTTSEARDIQNDFIRGKVNLLSSSTTFELGVDVGELQSVFLRNVPPSVANYLQRAGRAGRRADSAALILTYAQRKPHDLSKYADPVSLVSGKMRSPFVELENERIFQRHMYSVFFARYFKHSFLDSKKKAKDFFQPDSNEAHCKKMIVWIEANAQMLRSTFDSLLPHVLQNRAEELWLKTCSDFKELLLNVQARFLGEIKEYSDLIRQASENAKHFEAGRLQKVMDGLLNQDIISSLSKSNLIPKYGFPVDTVSLQPRRQDTNAEKVDLDRDLSIAIFEYSPGSTIVAAGYNWESIGLGYVPNKDFRVMQYATCPACEHFNEQIDTTEQKLSNCSRCGTGLLDVRRYLIPEWGFVASGGHTKPGDAPRMVSTQGRNLYLASEGNGVANQGPITVSENVTVELRTIADLVIVNSGSKLANNIGFKVCPVCRAAFEGTTKTGDSHPNPSQPDRTCSRVIMDNFHLGHKYQSDIVRLRIDFSGTGLQPSAYSKVVGYALLEGASKGLQIAHDDIDVISLPSTGDIMNIALVDAVPAGAGFAKLIADRIHEVFENALSIVSGCECGDDTSCYECLRTYRNQREHENLSRGMAVEALKAVTADM